MNDHLHTSIETLELSKGLLDDSMKKRLIALTFETESSVEFEKFDPSELDTLFTLVKTLQRKVVTNDSNLLANATTRDLSSLIGGITSLLRAFSAQQAKVDEAKELGDLKQAVLAAIESLDSSAQAKFYEKLESFG